MIRNRLSVTRVSRIHKTNRRSIESAATCTLEALESRRLLSANVLSYHNDLASTGQNNNETQLTPANLTVGQFGKRFSTTVDGQVYAQPLVVSNVSITTSGGTTGTYGTVVYVATEHDSLYAIDGDSGAVLWQKSFLLATSGPAASTVVSTVPAPNDVNTSDLTPEIGITATPVIDGVNGFLYLVAKSKQVVSGNTGNPHYVFTLDKVNIHDGSFTTQVIADTTYNGSTYGYVSGPSVVGTGDGSVGGRVTFNALREHIRSGLQLYNGKVYIAAASHGDNGPYHGWILGYDASTLAITAAFNDTPNGSEAGIWQGGGTIAIDPQGYFYVETGNGTFDSTLSGGFPINGDYGEAFLKLAIDTTSTQANQNGNKNGFGLKVVDYFIPYNANTLNSGDTDLGSGGPLILPDGLSATYPHLLIGAGKEGKLYLINRDNMGHYDPNTDHVVQELGGALPTGTGGGGSYDTPAYFNNTIYYVDGRGGNARTFGIANGVLTAQTSQSTDTYGFAGSSPSISSNNGTNAVVWTVDRGSNQLRAYNAATGFANELWTSAQATLNRDQLGTVVKFTLPTVANGRVFVGTANALVAYGPPVPPTSAPAAPTSLVATTISGVQINLAWADNANNEDGYSVEESIDGGATWSPIANLGVNSTSYSVTGLQVATSYSFRVRAFNSYQGGSYSPYSNVATAITDSQLPTIDLSNGFAGSGTLITKNGVAKLNGQRLELTDGGGSEAGSAFSTNAVPIGRFSTTFTFQITNPNADGMTFTIQGVGPTAIGNAGGGLGYSTDTGGGGIAKSLAIKFDIYQNAGDPSANSTGVFTNGASPSGAGSIDLTGTGIDLHSGDVFRASIGYDGTNLTETITDTTTNASWSHTYTGINLTSLVGASTAYIGFTGGTGGLTATQDILSWTFTPAPTAPPAAPSNLAVSATSGTQLNLTWTDNSNNEAGFKIYYRAGATGAFNYLDEVAANHTTYMATSLNPGVDYWFYVVATNSAGDSAPSNQADGATPTIPVTPSNLHATAVTTTTISLAWNDNSNNEQGFTVLRKKQTESDNAFVQAASLPSNTTSFTDTGLTPGVVYEYHVQAYNIAGYGDFTGAPVQTLALPPANVTAAPGGNQIVLSWSASSGAASYNVYRGLTPGGEGATPVATGITSTTFTDTGLTRGTTYYYKVTAVDGAPGIQGGGESAPSAEASAVPYLSGDVNNDGQVNFNDLLTLAQNYGQTSGATWAQGDLNGDGAVNFNDLLILAQNYRPASGTATSAAAASSVTDPLPSTSSILTRKRQPSLVIGQKKSSALSV